MVYNSRLASTQKCSFKCALTKLNSSPSHKMRFWAQPEPFILPHLLCSTSPLCSMYSQERSSALTFEIKWDRRDACCWTSDKCTCFFSGSFINIPHFPNTWYIQINSQIPDIYNLETVHRNCAFLTEVNMKSQ